jgi:hypothetical protein
MKITTKTILYCSLALMLLTFCGCGKTADENKPISEMEAEADKMSVEKLKSMAGTYKDAIAAKKDEAAKLASKLKDIPLTEMMGEKSKELKAGIDKLNESVSALTERSKVYYDKLKEKGGELVGSDK